MRSRIINPSRMQVPVESVAVEFDDGRSGTRKIKVFPNALAARKFWIAKDAAGKNPKIKKPSASNTQPKRKVVTAIYCRVSSNSQDLRSQEAELQKWAAVQDGEVVWFKDKASGRTMNRPSWNKLEEEIRNGSVNRLVVYRLDRLGRTAQGLTKLFAQLREWRCGLISIRESLDIDSPSGRLICHVLSSVAEYETEVRSERARAGIAAAKAQGRVWGGSKPGRRKASDVQMAMIRRMYQEGKTSILQIAKAVNLARGTVYSIIAS